MARKNHQPTQTLSGSEERIRVLQARVAARQSTTHRRDRSDDSQGIPVHHERNGFILSERRDSIPLLDADQPVTPTFRGNPVRFSTVLRLARKKAGLTQKQLGQRAGIYRARIDEWERGVQEPTLGNIVALSVGLGLPLMLGTWNVTV